MFKKIAAIFFIYCCTAGAWMILGSSVTDRTKTQDTKLRNEVSQLWGTPHRQYAPVVYYLTEHEKVVQIQSGNNTVSETQQEVVKNYVPLEASNVDVKFALDYRRKGLLWYSTYRVTFDGKYRILNPLTRPEEIYVDFTFPAPESVYDDFHFRMSGEELSDIQVVTGTLTRSTKLAPGQQAEVEIRYASQGMNDWWYEFGANSVTQVRNFVLNMSTDFDQINFPENSISPTERTNQKKGWKLTWKYNNLLSGVRIGMTMPAKLNPGPWVSKVIYSAPISLFLFFFLMFVFSLLKKVKIHPMNYFFLGASFFSFHLLLAYLVDHISIHAAFLISSVVSILLVVSYMRLAVGPRFAFLETGISQFVYLVLFAYTFFFEEYTGLAVTILCILTLFVVMHLTGRLNWEEISGRHVSAPALTREAVCPFCREELQSNAMTRCAQCGTFHHASCWSDHGGCAIFGCPQRAPQSTSGGS